MILRFPIFKISLVLVFFLLFSAGELTAQYKNIRFSSLTVNDGLSENSVSWVYQDSKGFMWFATQSGLNRYDGYNFKVYTYDPNIPGSISNNSITRIYEDKGGILWIGTSSGDLNCYDSKLDKFTAYKHNPLDSTTISGNTIRAIFQDSRNNLWIGIRDAGLNMFDNEGYIFKRNIIPLRDPIGYGSVIWDICEDKYGNLWMGASGNGIYMRNGTSGKLSNFLEHPDDSLNLSDDKIRCMHLDKEQNLWIGTWNGMKKLSLEEFYKTGKLKFKRFKTNEIGLNDPQSLRVNSICEDTNGILWVGTDGGLALFDRINERFSLIAYPEHESNGLLQNAINTIYQDKSGSIWIGSNRGISFCDIKRKKFNIFWYNFIQGNSSEFSIKSSPVEDIEGNFWLINGRNSICQWNKPKNLVRNFIFDVANKDLGNLFIDSKNQFWISVGGKTHAETDIGILDIETGKFIIKIANASGKIFEDKAGFIYVEGDRGLIMYDPRNGLTKVFSHDDNDPYSINNNIVDLVFEDSDSNLWVQTRKGLCNMDKKTGKFIQYISSSVEMNQFYEISNDIITAMHDDNKGNLWFATYGSGLKRFDKKFTITHINNDSGFADNFMNSLLADDHGNFWIGTKKGISKYDPKNGTIRNYGVEDGLQGREFGFSAFKSRSGEMFFGGEEGLNYFYPDSITDNDIVPPVVLTKFKVFDKEIKPDSSIVYKNEIELPYDSNFFSIEFSTLSFSNPLKNSYKYMLEGVDKNWVKTDASKRIAVYTDIGPGEYVFRVKGSNNDGLWNEEGASIRIIITPPWWQTWWFRATAIVMFICVLGYTRQRKLTKIHKEMRQKEEFSRQLISTQEQERKRIAGELHDSLGQNLLMVKNKSILSLKNINLDDKLRENFKDISELTSEALADLRAISYNLRPYELDRIGLTKTIEALIERAEKSTSIKYCDEIDDIDDLFPAESEIILYRIMQECINNITKHSQANEVKLVIKKIQANVSVSIKDNGTGFDISAAETKGGFGLKGINERVNLLKGNISIESQMGKGTSINIVLPYQFN